MSETVERRNAWIERVLAISVNPQARAQFEEEERLAARPGEQEGSGRAGYGEGLRSFDRRNVHANLTTALGRGRLVTADEWEAAKPSLDPTEKTTLLQARDQMKIRLAGLGAARTQEKLLEDELDRTGRADSEIKATLERVSSLREPPFRAAGSVGIPQLAFDRQTEKALDKIIALEEAARAVNAMADSPDKTSAAESIKAWSTYWEAMADALTKAEQNNQVGFDPDLIPKPGVAIDFTNLNSPDITAAAGKIAQLGVESTPFVPAPKTKIPDTKYDDEMAAAEAKLRTMIASQSAFEKIAPRTQAQEEALNLVKEWATYWLRVKQKLKVAKDAGDLECPIGSRPPAPARRPDLSTLKQNAAAEHKQAGEALARHRKTIIEPIERDMANCLNMLDAPESNPEREMVGTVLKMLDDLNQEIGAHPLTPQQVTQKAEIFDLLERKLFSWNDRRAQQHLPPSAEAMTVVDMLQAEHRKLIDHVVQNQLPLPVVHPVDGRGMMDLEEETELQENWKKLCEGSGNLKIPRGPDGANRTQAEADQFRSETLANFARLLGSPAGRKLVSELARRGKTINFEAGDSAECATSGGSRLGVSQPESSHGVAATTDADARAHKGTGTGSTVYMVRGAKDSDVAACTQAGTPMLSPRFIAMGHEMIHALHSARGIDRDKVTLRDDPIWNNSEELQTIRLGKLSEQTLRAQYGLSAERFGHRNADPGAAMGASYVAELAALDVPDNQGPQFGFRDFESWPRRLKKAVADLNPPIMGPLPSGWDVTQLNVEQIKLILDKKLRGDNLKTLGWSPVELSPPGSGVSLEQVLTNQQAHPRSPLGLRYRSLGDDAALQAVTAFKTATGIELAKWDNASWPSKLRALETADAWLTGFVKAKGNPFDRIAKTANLTVRLNDMSALMQNNAPQPGHPGAKTANDNALMDAQALAKEGGPAALRPIRQLNSVLGTNLPVQDGSIGDVLAAIAAAKRWLAALATRIDIDKKGQGRFGALPGTVRDRINRGGPLTDVLGDVVRYFRMGRANKPASPAQVVFLADAVHEANQVAKEVV